MAGRKRLYNDDKLESKCFRISLKYEHEYIVKFINILRKYRDKAIKFVEGFSND